MIIHELKRKQKDLKKYWENWELTEAVTSWRPKTTSHNNNGRAFVLKQSVLDFFFDKCEALRSRFTVIFFFFPKKKIVRTSNLPDTDSMCVLNCPK